MNWNNLSEIQQLEIIKEESNVQPVAIFKHSTRCSISATALDRFERNFAKNHESKDLKFYYLDLIAHRDISNKIASDFDVEHESPQLLLVKNGAVVFTESHYGIDFNDLLERV
ncbi:bacillithiol system redox-active protein YtxJ [Lacihabitans soyangensis]|jgi:bacillithiol system protein YtxJ|uniref:Bacillithiol system redox-active protein YtxJ n=2 Tax=Lacihabitans soyangensis TaxID=869394 RepID=A0AAE3H4D0_9BACT|nr:bacillithiol system redox-active protein YtxJ [Lacihabitans soyangensis]MCP9764713.1 bacillithiol system redox-active protein YtxJ [Lacihabitans soyangensis]